ncbi:sensor histidine kinase [Dactylosporangium sp. NPDC051541]|uniref:sensor histidine kinase n=1 Tax=Dactylosporangium sp. NPDC051541 TaxID=3363977 RepID=UPI0037879396
MKARWTLHRRTPADRPGIKRRWTLRRRLTLLYAGPFLVSGTVLLFVPLLGASRSVPAGEGLAPPDLPEVQVQSNMVPLMVFSVLAMTIVAIVLGWVVAGRFLRPLRLIVDTARDISATNLHRRLGPTGRSDELAELAETLDDLFERLEASFTAQRRFVANASHELRTPLTAQRTLLQVTLLDRKASQEELRAAAQEVLTLGESQARLIDSLLDLASGEQGVERREEVDLAEIAQWILDVRRIDEQDRDWLYVKLRLEPATTTGDADLIESMIANLVDNAIKHNVGGGLLFIATDVVDGRPTVTVENDGPVVPPEDVERLFQPFQRAGASRVRTGDEGYGLGLAIVRAIANAHDADLTVAPREGGGLKVTVKFR